MITTCNYDSVFNLPDHLRFSSRRRGRAQKLSYNSEAQAKIKKNNSSAGEFEV